MTNEKEQSQPRHKRKLENFVRIPDRKWRNPIFYKFDGSHGKSADLLRSACALNTYFGRRKPDICVGPIIVAMSGEISQLFSQREYTIPGRAVGPIVYHEYMVSTKHTNKSMNEDELLLLLGYFLNSSNRTRTTVTD